MQKIKKPISIILSILMVVSMFVAVPITASAAEETSTVTWDNNSLQKTSGGKSSGGVTLTTQQGNTRVNDCFYSGRGSATFTAPEGSVFTKIELKNARYVNNLNFPSATVAEDGGYWQESMWDDEDPEWVPYYTVSWTGESSEVTFSGAVYGIQSIVFTLKSVAPTTYTVTWKNGETVLKTDTDVAEGTTPTYNGADPEKASDTYYDYTFSGWTPAVAAVTGDTTYTATFTATAKTFKVNVKKLNGGTYTIENLTGETTVAQLKEIIADQIDIPATAQRLIFAGKEIEDAKTLAECNIQKESTIHLIIRSYTVTWLNYDNSELGTTNVQYGSTPTYNGEPPTKPEDEQNTYTFAGWSPEVSAVTGNATYTAQFDATPKVVELPEVIKDCTNTRDSVIFANVPFIQPGDFSTLADGAINFVSLAGGFALFDAKDYSYKFYDKNGTEIAATLSKEQSFPGSAVGLSDDVTIYNKEYQLSNTELDKYYIVATAPAPAPTPAKLILNVGENGKVVMNNGTFGNATDASNITEKSAPVNVADGAKVSIGDGHTCNIVEGGSINIATGGEVSFYPSADNTGKITAIPDEGYICTGWYNGDTRYTTKDTIDYQAISEDMTLTAKFARKLFTGHSVTLGGDVGVNFFLNPDVLNNYSGTKTVKFTVDGKETTVDVPTTATDNGYMVTCNVVAAQMAHKIKAVVYADGTALDQTDSYSVQDYAEGVYKDENKPEKLRALAKAMLNYGAMAQTVFAKALNEHPDLANTTVGNNGYADVTAEQIGDAVKGTSADLNKVAEKLGAEYYTSSLIYLSKNTLRLYFTPASKTVGALDGKGFSDSLSGYYYYVDHKDIAAAELDEQKELTVGDYTFTYTALDYAKAVVNSGMGGDQKNLAKALFLYNQAANAYFTPVHTHTPGETVQENVVPASCTAAGSYDEVVYCTECNAELSREAKTIDKLAHTITEVAEVPATTEADGVAAHYECSVCHALFTDAQGSNETTAEALVIPQIVENVVDLSTLTKGYEAQDGDVLINALDGQKYIRIADGATVKLRNANITCLRNSSGIDIAGLTLLGDATIILEGTNVIRGGYEYCPGIHVPEGKTLTIDGTGSLDVSSNGRGFACGIGSNDGTNCGNIVINGGNITAYAGKAAGIGAKSGSSCGNITINGGTVNATSGDYGAGIGSTLYGKSICGDITINGGVVNATANYEGPGIGSGTSANCGNITITGGTVTAIGGEEGAGIGTGNNVSICGNILINGGTVIAKGGNKAAGIGSGYRNTTCGTITIADTVTQVTATKGTDAPNSIGAGDSGSCGTVTIADGANVTQN